MDQPATTTLTVPPLTLEGRGRRLWRTYVTDVRATANARAVATVETDRRAVVVLVTAAAVLTCGNFLSDGSSPGWVVSPLRAIGLRGLATRLHDAMLASTHRDWAQLAFWAVVHVLVYVVPATLVIRFVLHDRVRDYGLRVRGVLPHARTYAVLYTVAVPAIFAASFSARFQQTYPFYHPPAAHPLWPYLYAWWALYWLQFAALEFFFRGFLLHGLAPRLGWIAIFAMVVPYNMIHYAKPMPEALAAIAGGIVLGTLSLKNRSIWWGAALHVAIALTMDVCALWHVGRL